MTTISQATAASAPRYANGIGGLRLLLACTVVYTHAYMLGGFTGEVLHRWSDHRLSLGTVAVQCFFVLSGWLLATSWRRKPQAGRFLWHRLLRLGPAMWTCLIVTAFVFTPILWLHAPTGGTSFFALEPSAFEYVWKNLWLPRSQISVGPYPTLTPWAPDWNASLWTIFYEGACYLMLLGAGLLGLLGRGRILVTVAVAGVVALLALRTALPPATLPRLLNELIDTDGKVLTWFFFAGAAWATWPGVAANVLSRGWVAALALAALVAAWHTVHHVWLSPLLLPLPVLWFAYHDPLGDLERRLGGDYSYGIYLYGYPVQQLLSHFQVPQLGFGVYLFAGLVVALGCAILSWHAVEKHALALKSFTFFKRPVPAPALV